MDDDVVETVAEAMWHDQNGDPFSTAAWRERGHYLRMAQAAIDALQLTREPYVMQTLGVSPVTLQHWERWATKWKETRIEVLEPPKENR